MPRDAVIRPGFGLFPAALAWVCAGGLVGPAHAQLVVAPASAPAAASSASSAPSPATRDAAPSYLLPAAEILGFQFALNRVNRFFGSERDDYASRSTASAQPSQRLGHRSRSVRTNQLGHPYQGSMYLGFARSAGLTTGNRPATPSAAARSGRSPASRPVRRATTRSRAASAAPSSARRCSGCRTWCSSRAAASRGSGAKWRPARSRPRPASTGWSFDDRYGGIFSSHGAAYFSRLESATATAREARGEHLDHRFKRNEAQADFSIDYGLPGSNGYEYTRPFDYFNFAITASSANGIENVLTRGLLVGKSYEAGPDYRGVWGIYGSYDYLAPQTFRVSSDGHLARLDGAVAAQAETLSLQGTAMAGVGYAAVGTTRGAASDRDYNYGVAPQALARAAPDAQRQLSLDLTGRDYFVSNVASGTSGGHDNIVRGDALAHLAHRQQQASDDQGDRQPARRALPASGHAGPDAGHGRRLLHAARARPLRHGRLALIRSSLACLTRAAARSSISFRRAHRAADE